MSEEMKVIKCTKCNTLTWDDELHKLNGKPYCTECIVNEYDSLTNELQQENKQLSQEVDMWNKKYNEEFDKNKSLNNNWNKLKEYLKSYIKLMNDNPDIIEQGQLDILYEVKDTIQELEQGSNNDE